MYLILFRHRYTHKLAGVAKALTRTKKYRLADKYRQTDRNRDTHNTHTHRTGGRTGHKESPLGLNFNLHPLYCNLISTADTHTPLRGVAVQCAAIGP